MKYYINIQLSNNIAKPLDFLWVFFEMFTRQMQVKRFM